MLYGWTILLGGAEALVVGPPTILGPADGPPTIVGPEIGLEVDEGATTGLDVGEEDTGLDVVDVVVEATGVGFDDTECWVVDATVWTGWDDGAACEVPTRTGCDEDGVEWEATGVGRADGDETGCAVVDDGVAAVVGFAELAVGFVGVTVVALAGFTVLEIEDDKGNGVGPWTCEVGGGTWETVRGIGVGVWTTGDLGARGGWTTGLGAGVTRTSEVDVYRIFKRLRISMNILYINKMYNIRIFK